MVDARPVRSCLMFAAACDGARIETIEGYADDALMTQLRDAFARHHALQCGFCTSGMLATARDLVARLPTPEEARIRNELSGNLCRCTGYVGIVKAIAEVISQRQAMGIEATHLPRVRSAPKGFAPFEAKRTAALSPKNRSTSRVATVNGWTTVEREVVLNHAADAVWRHFGDLRAVAACVPGVSLDEIDAGRFTGRIEVRFGLITACFEGEGTYSLSEPSRAGDLTGKAKDRNGQSNLTGSMAFRLEQGRSLESTRVAATFRFKIEGLLAQFNRPELVTGFVDFLLGLFIANCERVIAGGTASTRGLNAFALAWAVVIAKVRSLLKRS